MRLAVIAVALVFVAGCTGTPAPAPSTGPPATQTPSTPDDVRQLPPLRMPRAVHTATTLQDGRVLVVGGCTTDGCGGTPEGGQTELFDPGKRTFTPGPALLRSRVGHTATLLLDGRVLIAGGWPDEGEAELSSAELYDPGTETIRATGSMAIGRGGHTAIRLRDGRVLFVGGETVELYDPGSGTFRPAAPMPAPRGGHAATLLRDGRVLVVGGWDASRHPLDTALVYDPATNAWRDAGRLHEAKFKLAVAALPDGTALVIGGQTRDDPRARLATTELFDPRTNGFRAGPTMSEPRYKISDAVVALKDGRLVIAGGVGVEVYAAGRLTRLRGPAGPERQFPAVAALDDGTVLVTGGYDNSTRVSASAILVDPG